MKSIITVGLAAALLGAVATGAAGFSGGGGSSSGGGSGGGGNARHGGSYNLVFDKSGANAGERATCLGGYNITTYVTTLSLDYKIKGSGLPDGTDVYALVYTTDWFTGLPWVPMPAGAATIQNGGASFHNPNVVTTGAFGLPVFNQVVLSLGDGTPIFVGHP